MYHIDTTIFVILVVPITRAPTHHLNYQVSLFQGGFTLFDKELMILHNESLLHLLSCTKIYDQDHTIREVTYMLKLRMVFCQEGEDDVTTPQTCTTIAPNIKIGLKVNSFLQLQHILNENMMISNDKNMYFWSTTSLLDQLKQEFKLDRFWNPIRPPDQFGFSLTGPTSNVHNFHIRNPFELYEYLLESFSLPLSNGSSLNIKFLL